MWFGRCVSVLSKLSGVLCSCSACIFNNLNTSWLNLCCSDTLIMLLKAEAQQWAPFAAVGWRSLGTHCRSSVVVHYSEAVEWRQFYTSSQEENEGKSPWDGFGWWYLLPDEIAAERSCSKWLLFLLLSYLLQAPNQSELRNNAEEFLNPQIFLASKRPFIVV